MGFFLQFWDYIQNTVLSTVSTVTSNVASSLEPAAVTFATIYVMIWGYLHLRGSIEEPIMDGTRRILLLGAILGVALKLWDYNAVLVDFFVTSPEGLSQAVVGGDKAMNVVDTVWQQGAATAESLIRQGGILDGNVGFYFAGFAVYACVGLVCIWMAYLYCLSLVAVGLLLAIGPMFILGLMFETTKRFFEAWMAQLSNYALIIVIASIASKLLLAILQDYAAAASAKGTGITIAEGMQLCLACTFLLLIMRQVPIMASGLSGGVALQSYNALSRLLRGAGGGTGRTLYDFSRGVGDGRAGESRSRYMSLTRNFGNRVGESLRPSPSSSPPSPNKITRSAVF